MVEELRQELLDYLAEANPNAVGVFMEAFLEVDGE